ncbi:lipopolysaccharide biosynthesis protein [Blastococcus sp. SYSU DS0828]
MTSRRRAPAPDGAAPEANSLTRTTARGFVWSFGGAVSQALLSVATMVLLARLLTPAEFGAAAAAALVVGLATLVSQLGVGPAVVQRATLRTEQETAAWCFSLALGTCLGGLLFVLTPWINGLVGLPRENDLLHLLAVALPLAGLAAVPTGLLQRRLQFRAMSVVDALAAGPGAMGVSVLLAALGFGAWSIVWGAVASAAITAVGYTVVARPALRPLGIRAMGREVRPLLTFGSGYSLSQLGNWTALNADNLITANVLGTYALGIYGRAYQLLAQPANLIGGAVDKVLFPAMSKVQHDGDRLRTAFLRASSLVALVGVPGSAILFVLAPEVVAVLLGDGWSAVVLPLQVFALVLVPRASYKISGSLTRATGAVYRAAWRQWLYAAEVVAGCLIGSRWGIDGVAIGASVAILAHFLVMLHFSGRVAEGLVGMVIRLYALKYLPLAVVVFGAVYAVAALTRSWDLVLGTLLLAGGAGGLVTAAAVVVLRRAFTAELEVIGHVLRRRGGRAVDQRV